MSFEFQPADDPFDSLVSQMDEMLDEMSQRHFYHFSVRDAWEPSINLYETGPAYLLCMDLAGMDRDRIDVREIEGKLIIQGHRPTPQPPDSEAPVGVHLMEIDSGPFRRKIAIPPDVLRDKIRARYRDGFLWVTLPRVPTAPAEDNQS